MSDIRAAAERLAQHANLGITNYNEEDHDDPDLWQFYEDILTVYGAVQDRIATPPADDAREFMSDIRAAAERDFPRLDDEQIHYVASEVSHAMREGDSLRYRWTNQAMMLALNTIEHYRKLAEHPSDDAEPVATVRGTGR